MTCGNHRNIGTRPDLSEQLEPVLLPKPKIEYDQARVHAELRHNRPPTRGADNVDVIFIEVGDYHILDLGVVISDQDPHRLNCAGVFGDWSRRRHDRGGHSRGSNDLATCGYTTASRSTSTSSLWRSGEQRPLASPTARAVVFSALATGSAFGSLAFSRYPGMSQLGLLLSIELTWTLVCTLVVLPALLASVQISNERPSE
jgi:hypothetical protein